MRLSAVTARIFLPLIIVMTFCDFARALVLSNGSSELAFDSNGCPSVLTTGSNTQTNTLKFKCPRSSAHASLGRASYSFSKATAVTRDGDRILASYYLKSVPRLTLVIAYRFDSRSRGLAISREFFVRRRDGLKTLPADLTLSVPYLLFRPEEKSWLPLKNGTGRINELAQGRTLFKAAGVFSKARFELAIPLMVSVDDSLSKGQSVSIYADPYFSTSFGHHSVQWTYSSQVGLEDGTETRQIEEAFLSPAKDLHSLTDEAIDTFYKTVLADVPPGPRWLHDISMVSYDFMSKQGAGWKADLDALASSVPLNQRHRVMVTLHGWYDLVGKYSFTPNRKTLDSSWPSLIAPNLAQLDVTKIRARMSYAKDLGFKLGFYFADGLNSATDPRVDLAQNEDHILRHQGPNSWAGPDMAGSRAVVLNPSHPDVYKFFVDLARAEVAAYGDLVDAYVWDETFYVTSGDLGTTRVPGYTDRAFMRLTKEIASVIHQGPNNQAAFLTSDDLGLYPTVPPYALFADGDYQDANVKSVAWSYSIFPNYRNVAFGCNWWTKTRFNDMKFGVLNFQAPVAFTNGWADDFGFSEMSPGFREEFLKLFEWRSRFETQLRWYDSLPTPN